MVLIRESSDFTGKQIKVNTINSSGIGKLIIIEDNGILVLRDDGVHVYYLSRNIVSIEYVPPMGITLAQKKLQEKKEHQEEKKQQEQQEEKDDILKNADMERVKLLVQADKTEEIIDDTDYEVEINIDKIEIDGGDTAEIVGDEIIVHEEDFIQIAKEIAKEFNLSINRTYEE